MQTSWKSKEWCLRNPKAFAISILIPITSLNSKPCTVRIGIAMLQDVSSTISLISNLFTYFFDLNVFSISKLQFSI